MINVYVCEKCQHRTITRDKHEGTTPFIITCTEEGCYGDAGSLFYRVKQSLTPTYEWYRPTEEELIIEIAKGIEKLKDTSMESELGFTSAMRDHVERGGLLMRKIE